MCKNILESRAKDYTNPFRKMVYDNNEEMNQVVGRLEDNSFIQHQFALLQQMKDEVKQIFGKFKLD